MKRLTTDTPDGNFETLLNLVFSENGWAHIRYDGDGAIPLTQWAKAQCILHGCGEFSAETPEEIDAEISDCLMMDFPDCPIALAYGFAVQACHLRDRLKMYEDIFFAEDGTELLSLDDLQKLTKPNNPLTLDELREMSCNPVWLEYPGTTRPGEWMIFTEIIDSDGLIFFTSKEGCDGWFAVDEYGENLLAYRFKPKEVTL